MFTYIIVFVVGVVVGALIARRNPNKVEAVVHEAKYVASEVKAKL